MNLYWRASRLIGLPPVRSGGGRSPLFLRRTAVMCASLLFACAGAGPLWAGEPDGSGPAPGALDLSVEDAVALALRSNFRLKNSRLRRSVERFALEIAESEFRPRVVTQAYAGREVTDTAYGSTAYESSGVESSVRLRVPTGGEFSLGSRLTRAMDGQPGTLSHGGVMELTFTQPLLRGAGLRVGRAALHSARISEEVNVLGFKQAVMDLTSSVIRAYRSHVQARRQSEIAVRSLERARNLLEVNQLLVAAGRMAEQDVVQARADIARRELDRVAAQGYLEATRLALINVLDIATETQFGELGTLNPEEIQPPAFDSDQGVATALQNRPDYLGAELGVRNAELRADVARNDRLWDLSVTLGSTFSGLEDNFDGVVDDFNKTGHRVSLDLEIPLGRAAAGPAELAHRSAVADLQAARNSLSELRQRITIDVENALRNSELASQRLEIARTARSLAEQKAEIEREKLSLGVSTNFQLVTFENDLVLAETNELDAVVSYLNAITELNLALGTTLDRWGIDIDQVENMEAFNGRSGTEPLLR